VSGPLLDRIDLRVPVRALDFMEIRGAEGEASALVRSRVVAARAVQRDRLKGVVHPAINSAIMSRDLSRFCSLDGATEGLLERAFERLGLSMRSVTRILKVARTIADLGSATAIQREHVAEALQYRET
jgi:magnesium chelatase family protein